MDLDSESLALHRKARGKIAVQGKVPLKTCRDLSLAYTPGVAAASLEIAKDKGKAYEYTSKWNSVAVVSNGTAVLGLGDIGPEAALPVMEGKAILFKEFAGLDAWPICITPREPAKIIETVKAIAPTFGGINLEDIASPACFEVTDVLKRELDIPVWHDDQDGTAIVVLAALQNALKLAGKKLATAKIAINGAGAAGSAITKFLVKAGAKNMLVCDKIGILAGQNGLPKHMRELSKLTNKASKTGTLSDALNGADVFIGVSKAGLVSREMVASMAPKSIVFAMANPEPEIKPEDAKKAGAFIVGTGRSDYPNQINNVLAFPGVMKGAMQARAKITHAMMAAASKAISDYVPEKELSRENIVPSALDKGVAKAVSKAVAEAAQSHRR